MKSAIAEFMRPAEKGEGRADTLCVQSINHTLHEVSNYSPFSKKEEIHSFCPKIKGNIGDIYRVLIMQLFDSINLSNICSLFKLFWVQRMELKI